MTQANSQDQYLPIAVLAQYVRDLSFENPLAPASLLQQAEPPKLNMNVGVQTRLVAEGKFEVVLLIKADARIGEHPAFIVELAYAGLVGVPADLPEQTLKPLLLVETAKLLFPFAREIIADAVRDGGYAPLFITPVDFAAMYRQQQAKAA